jgi:hypothetical protein
MEKKVAKRGIEWSGGVEKARDVSRVKQRVLEGRIEVESISLDS